MKVYSHRKRRRRSSVSEDHMGEERVQETDFHEESDRWFRSFGGWGSFFLFLWVPIFFFGGPLKDVLLSFYFFIFLLRNIIYFFLLRRNIIYLGV